MAALDGITQLKAKIALLESKLKDYEIERASCTCNAKFHTSVPDEASLASNAQIQIPPFSPSDVQHSSVPPLSFESWASSDGAFIHYTPNAKVPRKRKALGSGFGPFSKPPRWKAAGRVFIQDVRSKKYNTDILRTQSIYPPVPVKSAFERGTRIAVHTATMLENAEVASVIASMGLFYFLSSLYVLRQLKVITRDQADGLMNHLDAKCNSFPHQRRIQAGAMWFHEKVILAVCNLGWELDHAIAVVATNAPRRPYLYDDINHPNNVRPAIEALQSVKETSMKCSHFGGALFKYIRYWEPSLGRDQVERVLYPDMDNQQRLVAFPDTAGQTMQSIREDELLQSLLSNCAIGVLRPKPITTESDSYVYNTSDIDPIRLTFSDFISDRVERSEIRLHEIAKTQKVTQCVKMNLSRKKFQDAGISLDVGCADEIASVLFPHVEYFTDPSSEGQADRDQEFYTLTKVNVSVMRSVFHPQICNAVDTSQLRAWEKEHLILDWTDCVMMQISRKKPQYGTITLRVGFLEGISIATALYKE